MALLVVISFLKKQLANLKKIEEQKVPLLDISDFIDERDDIEDQERCSAHAEQFKDLQCEDCDEQICAEDTKHNKHKGHQVITYDEHMQHFELLRQQARFQCDQWL